MSASKLHPLQKMEAMATFVQPCSVFPLRMRTLSKAHLEPLDKTVRAAARHFLVVGPTTSKSFLYSARKDGGAGLCSATRDHDIEALDSTYKLLTSRDTQTSARALEDVRARYCQRL